MGQYYGFAVFESVSGFTTTGATVISGLDHLPKSVLYYRQQVQWLGGMGVIVLAVAIIPLLGVGGMQLFRAETPGPMKDEKLTPRIAHTARTLWLIYLGLTVACALAFWLAGMTPFDAIGHSFTAISTGGFYSRRQHGLFRQPSDRDHRQCVHDARGHQFRGAFHGLAATVAPSLSP